MIADRHFQVRVHVETQPDTNQVLSLKFLIKSGPDGMMHEYALPRTGPGFALGVLAVYTAAWQLNPENRPPPQLQGRAPSAATSLHDTARKAVPPDWLTKLCTAVDSRANQLLPGSKSPPPLTVGFTQSVLSNLHFSASEGRHDNIIATADHLCRLAERIIVAAVEISDQIKRWPSDWIPGSYKFASRGAPLPQSSSTGAAPVVDQLPAHELAVALNVIERGSYRLLADGSAIPHEAHLFLSISSEEDISVFTYVLSISDNAVLYPYAGQQPRPWNVQGQGIHLPLATNGAPYKWVFCSEGADAVQLVVVVSSERLSELEQYYQQCEYQRDEQPVPGAADQTHRGYRGAAAINEPLEAREVHTIQRIVQQAPATRIIDKYYYLHYQVFPVFRDGK